jgi:alanine racemase
MNRLGFSTSSEECRAEAVDAISSLFGFDGLLVEGIFTHFARADESGVENDEIQFKKYSSVVSAIEERGHKFALRHVCNSAASLRHPEYYLDAVRLGIVLYGVNPSDIFDFPLLPVMKLKTDISHIHALSKGECVSYGGIYTAETERRIATIPIGYADGFLRAYSGAEVYIETKNGIQRAPIIGRICMDQCMIDITDTDASVGDTVTLFGENDSDLRSLSRLADTIPYECLCLVSGRVPRIIV